MNNSCTCLVIGSGWISPPSYNIQAESDQTTKYIYILHMSHTYEYYVNESWNLVIFFPLSSRGITDDSDKMMCTTNRASTRGNNGKKKEKGNPKEASRHYQLGVGWVSVIFIFLFFFSDVLPAGG
jgi:hypothetical protein